MQHALLGGALVDGGVEVETLAGVVTGVVPCLTWLMHCPLVHAHLWSTHKIFFSKDTMINRSKDQMINSSVLTWEKKLCAHMEKLILAQVERLLWSKQGSTPVPFGL
jgi:hypothetical protein